MRRTELGNWDAMAGLELLVRGAVYALTGVATLALIGVFGFAAAIAIGGTGAFTSSPPPEHPAWFGVAVSVCLYAISQWGVVRLKGYLLASLDKIFGGSSI